MPILANSPADLASRFPFPAPDPDTIHGVPLADLLARCRSIAQRFHRQHGRREPYEEYLSIAHMTLVECLARYDPTIKPPGGFLAYSLFQIAMACRHVRRFTAGSGNMPRHIKGQEMRPTYAVECWEHTPLYALRTEQARQETCVYLQEVVGELAHHGAAGQMLLALAAGELRESIAARWECTEANVKSHTVRLRSKLRAWSTAVSPTTDSQEYPS